MSDVSLLTQLQPSGSVKLNEESTLAKAQVNGIDFESASVAGQFDKPMDLFMLSEAEVGLKLSSPDPTPKLLTDTAVFGLSGGVNAKFAVLTPKQKTLFADDQFAPPIPIAQGECWASLTVSGTLEESVSALVASVGVSIKNGTTVNISTLVHFPDIGATIPDFRTGFCSVLENFTCPDTPAKIRATPQGIAYTLETSGTLTLGVSYKAPLQLQPLAKLNLPLNLSLTTNAGVSASVSGSIALEGSFVTRIFRSSASKLMFGVYKKRQTTLKVELTESTGIGEDVGKTDLLSKVLNTLIPAADLTTLRLSADDLSDLKAGLKDCVDESIAIAVNNTCSADACDEAAVIYELDLSSADIESTDKAIASALRGDWSRLESLPNAHATRHIIRDLQEEKHKLNINLLGFYNATSIADYVRSTAVVHDEHGQITVTDKAEAKSLLAGVTPYAAKTDKLRAALGQAFVATTVYGAAAGRLAITSFTVKQSFLEFHARASSADLNRHLLLAKAIGFTFDPEWEALVKADGNSNRSQLFLESSYDQQALLRLFYADSEARVPHSPADLDRVGRDTKLLLLDPASSNAMQRRKALSSDEIWNDMNSNGNVGKFKEITGLAKLEATAVVAISTDWREVRWWSDAMQALAPRLTAVLTAIDQAKSGNPLSNSAFMAARKHLESAMADLSHTAQGAFGEGWGLAVMYRLAAQPLNGAPPSVQMDIGWNKKFGHQHLGAAIAVGKAGGD